MATNGSVNWTVEIPVPTGDPNRDYLDLYEWAQMANEELKRNFNRVGEVL